MAKKPQKKIKVSVTSPKVSAKKKSKSKAKKGNAFIRVFSVKKESRLGRLLAKRHAKPIAALVVILMLSILGSVGYNLWGNYIAEAVTPLNKTSCLLRGRKYTTSCTKICTVGRLVVDTPYDYCSGTASPSLSRTTCDSKGRVWLTGNGCARNPFQTTAYNALQCTRDGATYRVASIDYCSGGSGGSTTSGGGWTWPVPGRSINGARWGQTLSRGGTHKGIDIGAPRGTRVVAAHGGKVTKSGTSGDCGPYLVIKASGTSYWYAYQHLQNRTVGVGSTVSAGQKIGEIGSGGTTSCGTAGYYHLHFSVEKGDWISYRADSLSRSINPCAVLPGC